MNAERTYLRSHTPRETFDEMKETCCGEDAPSYKVVKHWHHQLKCGRLKRLPFLDSHSAIDEDTVEQVAATILDDRHKAVC